MTYKCIYAIAIIFCSINLSVAQETNLHYSKLIKEGWTLCLEKDFIGSAKLYEEAFRINKSVPLKDRYNASCIYALSGNKNSAFRHLFIIANDLKWGDYNHLINDSDLNTLHLDKRWAKLKSLIKQNKSNIEVHFDKELVATLDQIYFDDQSTRSQIKAKEEKYGRDSKEMKVFWKTLLKKDSLNLIKVSRILDSQGWPQKKKIGDRGVSTLFLVIQHSNLQNQLKYLPMITKAMESNNLPKRQYAMFYDRVVLGQGKRQLYGTQLAMSKESEKPYVLPLEAPESVDERRMKMGLNTMQENLNRWGLTWDVEAYLTMLPQIEAKEKNLNKQNNN